MNVFTNVYGLARSIIATSTMFTLAFNSNLFPLGTDILDGGDPAFGWNLFVLLGPTWGRFVGVASLALVASGWRPRLTGLVHLWVAASLAHTPAILDGGEHVAQAMATIMLPLTLLDPRRSHFGPAPELSPAHAAAAHIFMVGIRLQVCLIYLEAFVDKFRVEQWRNGTALYYWISDPLIGSTPLVEGFLRELLSSAFVLPLVTWSALALEFVLAACLFARISIRRTVLPFAVAFHVGIAILFGISSFALIMIGCLLVYLLPAERGLAFVGVLDRAWSKRGTRCSEANEIPGTSVAGVGAS